MSLPKLLLLCVLSGSFVPLPCHAQVGEIYPSRVPLISGECEADLKPTVAVISGGVASSALKPTAAVAQLDKQLALIRGYVQQNQGTLKELERVRMIHTEGSNNGQPRDPDFQVAQRFHAEFPVDAPMDQLLEHMIELGMDRFGENMSLPEYRQSIVVVHFDIQGFDRQLTQIRNRCLAEAWKQWCASGSPKSVDCSSSTPPESLQIQSFYLRSTEKIMRADGPPEYINITYSAYQPRSAPPELLGNVPIHFVGNIVLNGPALESR
ncbi:MAG TPA: SIMPL domain-containing protein [Terriglobales bacterium]|nr:SIMPL domain-containing protein [Terriglobales bacterium]